MNTETLRALASKATKGPYWVEDRRSDGNGLWIGADAGRHPNDWLWVVTDVAQIEWDEDAETYGDAAEHGGHPGVRTEADAAYFAALDPATVLKLLDCVEALGEVEEYLGFWGVHDGAGPNEIADHGRVTELVKAALATPDAAQSGGEGE